MDDIILRAILLDAEGEVKIAALVTLLQRIRKVSGAFSLHISPRGLDAHDAGHLVKRLDAPEKKDCTRRDTGERFYFYEGSVEVGGQKAKVTLFCNDEEELACAS